jgi:PAS domain S-box-containing protein
MSKPWDRPLLTGEPAASSVPTAACFSLFQECPDPVVITDARRAIVFLNPAAEYLLAGYLALGDRCSLCAGPEVQENHPEDLPCPQAGDLPVRTSVRLKGTNRRLSVTVSPWRGPQGDVAGCLIMLKDLDKEVLAHPAVQMQMATLSSILENFPMPFFMVDANLTVTHMNRHMERLTGYSREEAVGKMQCGSLLNTVQCNTEACPLQQVMHTRQPVSGLRRVARNRQGREIEVSVSASIIIDAEGRVVGGFEACRDITPLMEAQKQITLLAELAKEGILLVDEDMQVLYANPKLAEIVNRPKEELTGQDLGEVLSPQHRRAAHSLLNRVGDDETHFISTLDPLPWAHPERRVFETWMALSRIGGKNLIYLYLRDLTNRIRMGRELHKANNFLTKIIQCSVDGIVVLDAKGVPLLFNEGAERILGYRAEEVIGNKDVLLKFYPAEVATEMKRRMRSPDFGAPDKLTTTQITFISKAGEEVPVNFSAAVIREGGKEVGSVGIFSDLRETLRMRRELEKSQTQLLQAEKIASLGRLSAGVAHEINNPLAGILIYAELLQRQMQEADGGRDYVDEIITQTMRCQQIVHRLLEFSRQSLGERTLVNVNEIITRVVNLLKHQVSFHDVAIDLDLHPDLPQITGDFGELQQVFTNLTINARDAMDGQGRIAIATWPRPNGQGIVITLSDTGCGIPEPIMDKIFEPFFTTKPVGQGTGLGLAIVFGVIQRHGGTVEVDSVPGGGTTFILNLPLETPLPAAGFIWK